MKAFLGQLFRILLGIGLLPFGVGYGLAFADQLAVVRQVQSAELSFLLGITGYLAFHALVAAPTRAPPVAPMIPPLATFSEQPTSRTRASTAAPIR